MSSNTNWVLQYYSKLYPQNVQASTQSNSSSSSSNSNQNLINLLFNHKIIIENLLENQNSLKNKVQKLINLQNNIQYDQQKYTVNQQKNNFIHANNTDNKIKIIGQDNINTNNINHINNFNKKQNDIIIPMKKYQNNITNLNNLIQINYENTQYSNNPNSNIQNYLPKLHDNHIKQRQKQHYRLKNQVNYIIKPVHKKAIIQIVSTCPDVQNQQNQSSSDRQFYTNSKNNRKLYHNNNSIINNNNINNNNNSHYKNNQDYNNNSDSYYNQNRSHHNNNQNYLQNQNQQNYQQKHPKGCQTKNVIKNYGKSILTFIRKNRQLVSKISISEGFDQKQFFYEFEKFRGNVNSISELKIFWTEKGNRFAKIFRIISNLYLKKHSIKHTFNSRVKNYALHIKYRKRLLDILRNPQDFTSLKYF